MLNRTAKVDFIKIDSAITGSCVQIGDSSLIFSYTRAIAVQREQEIFYSNEANFDSYEVFSYVLPIPPLDEQITFHPTSFNPIIKVGTIESLGACCRCYDSCWKYESYSKRKPLHAY